MIIYNVGSNYKIWFPIDGCLPSAGDNDDLKYENYRLWASWSVFSSWACEPRPSSDRARGRGQRSHYREQNLNRVYWKVQTLTNRFYSRKSWLNECYKWSRNIEITICAEIMYLCEYFFIWDKPSWQWTPRTLASLIKLLVSGGASSSQSEARVGAWWPMRGRVVRELGTILLSGTSPSRTPRSASTLHRHHSGIPASRELFRSRGYNLVNHSHFVLASSPGSLGG